MRLAADAVVIHRHKILLVQRKDNGLLALPGGFLEENETFEFAARRECEEETNINLKDQICYKTEVFDSPIRDPRGRVITVAHLFYLPTSISEYKPQGKDDAACAFWCSLISLHYNKDRFFIDHYSIITEMLHV